MENWKSKKYWLNEWGERYWYKNSDITITAHRSYHWVDRIVFIEESSVIWLEDKQVWTTSDRHCNQGPDITYTKFKEQLNDWTPIEDYDEYTQLLRKHYECKKYNLV